VILLGARGSRRGAYKRAVNGFLMEGRLAFYSLTGILGLPAVDRLDPAAGWLMNGHGQAFAVRARRLESWAM
jgi:hypothetical protein